MDAQQDLFPQAPIRRVPRPDAAVLAETAIETIAKVLGTDTGAVGFSGGKDSSLIIVLTMMAAQRVLKRGGTLCPIHVMSGDTETENPAVATLRDHSLETLGAWAEKAGLPVRCQVYKPQLNSTWAVKMLSGSALPRYPNAQSSDCSMSWKVEPGERTLRRLMPALIEELDAAAVGQPAGHPSHELSARARRHALPVVLLGSRRDESAARCTSMAKHGQRADQVSDPEDGGRRTLSPISDWREEDVWEILGLAGTDRTDYPVWLPDFNALISFYKDLGGGACVALGTDRRGRSACGSRSGCWTCTASTEDRSMAAMVAGDRYRHLHRLAEIRDFIGSIQYDWSRRRWTGRHVDPVTCHLRTGPDTFDDETLDAITLATLSADRAEALRADSYDRCIRRGLVPHDPLLQPMLGPAGSPLDPGLVDRETATRIETMRKPTYLTLTPRHVIALDFYRSLLGRGDPFQALHLYDRVWNEGEDHHPPPALRWPPSPVPPTTWTPVTDPRAFSGIGDPLAVALEEWMNGGVGEMVGDQIVPDHQLGLEFDVDAEAAGLVLDLEWPSALRRQRACGGFGVTHAASYYLRMGVVQVSKRHRHAVDRMMRRTNAMEAAGLLKLEPAGIAARSISDRAHRALGGGTGISAKGMEDLFH